MASKDLSHEDQFSTREAALGKILAECSDRLNAGEEVDFATIIQSHPQLAPELGIALEGLRDMQSTHTVDTDGKTLGDYQLIRELGRGGMGMVYEAWHAPLDRRVALKVLPEGHLTKPTAVKRFLREAKVAGRLQHPNIVPVYDMGMEGARPYFAMELVQGETLGTILERLRPPEGGDSLGFVSSITQLFRELEEPPHDKTEDTTSPSQPQQPQTRTDSLDTREINLTYCLRVAEAFAGVADGLHHAHTNGTVHRDLKPSNLILDRAGRLRILDFGLAHLEGHETLTLSGELLGTPLYMSPEQALARRAPIDHRTDIYSLGATIYEMLGWRPPFQGKNYQETLSHIVCRDPQPLRRLNPRIPKDLETIVLKCLEKDPAHRYATAEALGQDLRRLVRGDPIEARARQWWERVARRAWRRKGLIATAASVVLLIITFGVLVRRAIQEAHVANTRLYDHRVTRAAVTMYLDRPGVRRTGSTATVALASRGTVESGIAYAAVREPLGVLPDPLLVALNELKAAVALFPDRPEAHCHLAGILTRLGRHDEARQAVDRAIACDPHFLPAWVMKALAAGKQGSDAARDAEEHLKRLDNAPWAAEWLGAYRATAERRWPEAIEQYTIDAEFDGAEPYQGFSVGIRLARGRARLETKDLNGALEDFAVAHAFWPELSAPVILLGKTYLLKDAPVPAEQRFERFYRRTREPDRAALDIAAFYYTAIDYERGLHWVKKAAESDRRERIKSALLRRLERHDEAVTAAKRAVELDEHNPNNHGAYATALIWNGRLEDGIAEYRAALSEDPRSPGIWSNLGNALELKGDWLGALKAHREAVKLNPQDSRAHLNLGIALRRKGKTAEARTAYEKAVTLKPHLPEAHCGYGALLRAARELDRAIAQYREAISLNDQYAMAYNNLGNALWEKGDRDGAGTAYKQAITYDPNLLLARSNYARLLFEQGSTDHVLPAWREALTCTPEPFDATATDSYFDFGLLLERAGELAEAEKAYRAAVKKPGADPSKLVKLGLLLRRLGRFTDAVAALREGHERGSKEAGWRFPSEKWLRECEKLAAMEKKLPAVLSGKTPVEDARENLSWAQLCLHKKRYADAALFWKTAFDKDATLAVGSQRYNAACAAARAGATLDGAERRRWLAQALAWLQAEFARITEEQADAKAEDRQRLRRTLKHWLTDPDLAALRNEEDRKSLGKKEQAACRALWKEVWAAAALAGGPEL